MIGRIAAIACLLAFAGTAEAYGSLRCKGKLIRVGTTAAHVLSLCGEPRNRIVHEVPVRSRVITGFSRLSGVVTTEQWEYDRGWGKFPVILRFRDGELRRMEYLSYRSGKR